MEPWREKLEWFLNHINSIHPNIQFTMKIENNRKLPFLDVLITRAEDKKLEFTVYRKPTHTDRYLERTSNHHPRQKRGIIKTLVERAKCICDPKHLTEELQHLNKVLQSNGYSKREIKRAINPNKSAHKDKEQVAGKVFLPYVQNVTDRIGKLMERHKFKVIYRPTTKIQEMLRSAKDKREPLLTAGVYRTLCSCGEVYIGTTKQSTQTRVKEHERHCRLYQPEKSSIACWKQDIR